MVVADLVEDLDGVVDGVTLCPANTTIFTRVIEAVLRFGSYQPSANEVCAM